MIRPSAFLFVAIAATLVLCGCERASSPQEQASTPAPATLLAAVESEAPAEWSAFEAWVEKEIQIRRQAVPLPADPVLASPSQPCLRLETLVDSGAVECGWSPPAAKPAALLTLGPFDTSTPPNDTFLFRQDINRKRGKELLMAVRGFEIAAEDVGSVSLRVRVPFGKWIDLIWSTDGRIRLPVPDNEQFWTLDVSTQGLTDWKGPIKELQIRTDGHEDAVFEIEKIEFRSQISAFPQAVGVERPTVDRVLRTAIYAHSPAVLRLGECTVPPDGQLRLGLAAVAEDLQADVADEMVTLRVDVLAGEKAKTVLEERVAVGQPWHDVGTSLAAYAGQRVRIELRTETTAEGVVALWSDPVLYQPVANPPLVILYLIDAMSAKHLNLYGYQRETTPNITALAEEGVWFANMYANSPVTVASVPDTQLSMSSERHGLSFGSAVAPEELVSIADACRAAGFATASFITNPNAGPRQNMDQGFDQLWQSEITSNWEERTAADRTVPIAAISDWLGQRHDRPAYVYVHTCEPHAPYTPPPGFDGRFDPDYAGGIDGTYDLQHGFAAARTQRDVEHIAALYDEECYFADHMFGEFWAKLREEGYAQRATVFVIADHGEELTEHGHWGHGPDLYNEVMRVPLVASGPLVTARGRVDIPANLYDIMPTMLDLLDLPQPYELFGVSLRPLMQQGGAKRDPQLTPERTLFISHHRWRAKGYSEYAVVEAARWKLIYHYMREDRPNYPKPARFELYDLGSDPGEKHDVYAEQPEIARRLMCQLVAYARQQFPYEKGAAGLQYDPEQLRELRSLGYVGD